MRRGNARVGTILVLGDIIVDVIGRVKAWPNPGDDCWASRLELHCGGVAANCAMALASWGMQARLLGCVGQDAFGDYLLESLAKRRVDAHWVQRTDETMTGLLYVNVTPDGQRTFFGSRGANGLVRRVPQNSTFYAGVIGASLVGYNFLDPATEKAARQIIKTIRSRGGWVSMDAGVGPCKQIPRKLLKVCGEVDILFVGQEEATLLTGMQDDRKAYASLAKTGVREVVLKIGKRGCLISDGENGQLRRVPSFPIKAVDTTGAGDSFVAAFLHARVQGWPTTEAALLANTAGAVTASIVGAGEKLPSPQDVIRLLRTSRLNSQWDPLRLRIVERLQKTLRNAPSSQNARRPA
ncbi:MAG TPA: carbohydrate kinase family protein [Candidatus Dormibacteraeota bacterium]|nr:carbohydrate kinase family protein [Candidatus Dormibacteraeota bacterium]